MRQDWKRLRFAPVVLLGVFAFVIADYIFRGPKAKEKQSNIESELRSILDPPSSSLIYSRSGFKTSGGYTKRILRTNLALDELDSYYRSKLEEQKWFYLKEEVILSNRRAIFCNGTGEAAVLAMPEKAGEIPYEYSLTITWDNTEGCK